MNQIMTDNLKSRIVNINKEKSKEICNHYSSLLENNQCYMNAFRMESRLCLLKKWKLLEDRVVYGYLLRENENGYKEAIRHCWLFVDGDYIEVTPSTLDKEGYLYIPFKELNADKYADLIEKNNMYPSLDKALSKEETEFSKILKESGFTTCSEFLERLGLTAEEYNALDDKEKHLIALQEMLGLI